MSSLRRKFRDIVRDADTAFKDDCLSDISSGKSPCSQFKGDLRLAAELERRASAARKLHQGRASIDTVLGLYGMLARQLAHAKAMELKYGACDALGTQGKVKLDETFWKAQQISEEMKQVEDFGDELEAASVLTALDSAPSPPSLNPSHPSSRLLIRGVKENLQGNILPAARVPHSLYPELAAVSPLPSAPRVHSSLSPPKSCAPILSASMISSDQTHEHSHYQATSSLSPEYGYAPLNQSIRPTYPLLGYPSRNNLSPSTLDESPKYPVLPLIPGALSSSIKEAPRSSPLLSFRRYKLPYDLVSEFVRVAANNTQIGKETCGHLLGTRTSRDNEVEVEVKLLVIPSQEGTSNTCSVSEEGELQLLEVASQTGLLTVGWIHTHPTQDCFLSSVDLHTALPLQKLLPEAISVVVAPTDSELPVGFFRLSDYGERFLPGCRKEGFHNHDGAAGRLFEQIPREVLTKSGTGVVLKDLRH